MEKRDPYRILQVQPDADIDVVKAAFRVLARKVHPDASTPLNAAEERRMTDLNWAYATVRDPLKRRLWEADRRRAPPQNVAEGATHGASRGPLDADGSKKRLDFGRYEGWTIGEIAPSGPRLPHLAPAPRLGCPVSRGDRPDPAGDKGLGAASGAVSALEDHDPPRSVAPPHRIERARDPLEVDPLRDQQVERHAAGGVELRRCAESRLAGMAEP